MFVLNYVDFVDCNIYKDFSISYMSGIKVSDMKYAKVIVDIDSKSAYIYCD